MSFDSPFSKPFDPLGQKSFDAYVYEKTKGEIKKTNDTLKLDDKVNEKNLNNTNLNTENKEEIKPELLKNNITEKEIKNPVSLKFNSFGSVKGLTENIKHHIASGGDFSRLIKPPGEEDLQVIKKMKEIVKDQ